MICAGAYQIDQPDGQGPGIRPGCAAAAPRRNTSFPRLRLIIGHDGPAWER
jgi:hypothetical protein